MGSRAPTGLLFNGEAELGAVSIFFMQWPEELLSPRAI